MIELIVAERCNDCCECVTVCPTNVFDIGALGQPVIARQDECQTCFMCELYCQQDALFVGADRERSVPVDPAVIVASGLLGQFRRDSGWHEWADQPEYASQFWRMGQVMTLGRELTVARQARARD